MLSLIETHHAPLHPTSPLWRSIYIPLWSFSPAALSEEALDAKMQAMDASRRAEMAANTVSQISGQLETFEEWVTYTIPDHIELTNIEAAQAQAQGTSRWK